MKAVTSNRREYMDLIKEYGEADGKAGAGSRSPLRSFPLCQNFGKTFNRNHANDPLHTSIPRNLAPRQLIDRHIDNHSLTSTTPIPPRCPTTVSPSCVCDHTTYQSRLGYTNNRLAPPPILQHQIQQAQNCANTWWQAPIPLARQEGQQPEMR